MASRVLLLSIVFLVATTQPAAAGVLGTPDDPELADPEGDVSYGATYLGPQDMDYLDILAAWFAFNATDDQVSFTLRVQDATELSDPPDDFRIECRIQGNFTAGGSELGVVTFRWLSGGKGSPVTENVTYSRSESEFETTPIPHSFELNASEPGEFRYHIDRERLLNYGEAIENLRGRCNAIQWAPGGYFTMGGGSDDARGSKAYVMTDLEPERPQTNEGAEDANETNESRPGEASAPSEGTPGPAGGILVLTVAASALLWRVRRPDRP